jgi:3-methyladenine DNA glycosylase Tag
LAVPTIPDVIVPSGLSDYLEVMTRAVFQAGVRWQQIAQNWEAYGVAFAAFDPIQVAAFDDLDVERALQVPGILRMRKKAFATVNNAKALLEVERDFGSVGAYVASFPTYPDVAKDMKKRFSFMGDMNVWYVLFRTGHPVPRFEPWLETIDGDHPRMREMVDLARSQQRSPEV